MKPYQVLTQESIERIECVIKKLELIKEGWPIQHWNLDEEIEDLKAILTDVRE